MAIVYFPFTPNINTPFQFQPTLDGATYSAVITWNLFAQRYYISVYGLDGALIFSLPVIGSPNWTNVQLTTTYQSRFATIAATGSSDTTFLITNIEDFILTDDENRYIITQQLQSPPLFSVANGARILSNLVPDGTYIDVVADSVISISVGASATGTDINALLNNDINIAKGYFLQNALVYRQSAARFEVYDIPTPATLPGKNAFIAEGFPASASIVSPFPVPAPPPPPAPVFFDDAASGGGLGPTIVQVTNGRRGSSGLTTTLTNDVIIVGVSTHQTAQTYPPPQTNVSPLVSLTSTSGLKFKLRGIVHTFSGTYNGSTGTGIGCGGNPPCISSMEIYSAIAPMPLTNEVITATFIRQLVAGFVNIVAFNSTSFNPQSLWDTSPTLPKVATDFSHDTGGSATLCQVTDVSIAGPQGVIISFGTQYLVGGIDGTLAFPGPTNSSLAPGSPLVVGTQYYWNGLQAIQVFDGYYITDCLCAALVNGPAGNITASTNLDHVTANWACVADSIRNG